MVSERTAMGPPCSARKLRDNLAGRLSQSTQEISNVRDVLAAYDRK